MRISDWSSDVCSSDLLADHGDGLAGADVEGDVVDHRLPLAGDAERGGEVGDAQDRRGARHGGGGGGAHDSPLSFGEIGRASWREKVGKYVEISVVAEALKTKDQK